MSSHSEQSPDPVQRRSLANPRRLRLSIPPTGTGGGTAPRTSVRSYGGPDSDPAGTVVRTTEVR